MLVLSFQKVNIAKKISNGLYKPTIAKSDFATSSVEFSIGYNKVLSSLRELSTDYMRGDSCIWAWVSNPDELMTQVLISEDKVAMYLDVEESKIVYSDYDKYTKFVQGESDDSNFIITDLDKAKADGICIQCSFMLSAIKRVVAVYTCSSFMLYNEISRSMYYQTLCRSIPTRGYTIYDKIRLKWNLFVVNLSKTMYNFSSNLIDKEMESNMYMLE